MTSRMSSVSSTTTRLFALARECSARSQWTSLKSMVTRPSIPSPITMFLPASCASLLQRDAQAGVREAHRRLRLAV